MGGARFNELFKKYARRAPNGSAIVELGTWLGAGTRPLCEGVQESGKDVEIHSYDKFEVRGNEIEKAAQFKVNLKDNQNTLPLVKKWLKEYKVKLFLHKCEITDQKWETEKPIFLYIDDACKYKETFIPALKIFSPYWIPGITIIVLMDFYFYLQRPNDLKLKFQKEFIQSHPDNFELITSNVKLSTAIFKYKGGLVL